MTLAPHANAQRNMKTGAMAAPVFLFGAASWRVATR